jgi:hypothetical protein
MNTTLILALLPERLQIKYDANTVFKISKLDEKEALI